jgi:hypothetical protein
MRSHPRIIETCLAALALSIVLTHASAREAGAHGYRTDTLVPSAGNECAGAPSCLSVGSPGTTVRAGGRASARFACPSTRPNLWGWDSAQHEHILVKMVAVDRSSVTVEGVNNADVPGGFVISLGCSTEPYAGTGIQKSRQLAPTAQLTERRPPRKIRGTPADLGDLAQAACQGVPDCQPGAQATFSLSGWETSAVSYQCQSPFPYAWNFAYSQTGSPSVSAIGAIFEENPGTYDVLLTNWNPFATDDVTIVVGCSKDNSFTGGSCGAPQSDPGCPVVAGSQHTYCSRGPVPVCFFTWNERCSANNLLYTCTDDVVVPWCQPCPGQ